MTNEERIARLEGNVEALEIVLGIVLGQSFPDRPDAEQGLAHIFDALKETIDGAAEAGAYPAARRAGIESALEGLQKMATSVILMPPGDDDGERRP